MNQIKNIVEALLLSSGEPLSAEASAREEHRGEFPQGSLEHGEADQEHCGGAHGAAPG